MHDGKRSPTSLLLQTEKTELHRKSAHHCIKICLHKSMDLMHTVYSFISPFLLLLFLSFSYEILKIKRTLNATVEADEKHNQDHRISNTNILEEMTGLMNCLAKYKNSAFLLSRRTKPYLL